MYPAGGQAGGLAAQPASIYLPSNALDAGRVIEVEPMNNWPTNVFPPQPNSLLPARPNYMPYPAWGMPAAGGGCAGSGQCASSCMQQQQQQQWARPW